MMSTCKLVYAVFFVLMLASAMAQAASLEVPHVTKSLGETKTRQLGKLPMNDPSSMLTRGGECLRDNEQQNDVSLIQTKLQTNVIEEKLISHDNPLLLRNKLQCPADISAPQQQRSLNFLAVAAGEVYEDLLPLYAFSALSFHEDAVVEIIVPDPLSFIERHATALSWLTQPETIFPFPSNDGSNGVLVSNICVRNYTSDHSKRTGVKNTWRYLEVPAISAKYTYLGDIDLFFTESVLNAGRMAQMRLFGLPYSNIVRPGSKRLTGLMLTETSKFYTPTFVKEQLTINASGNDEEFLYRLVEKSGLRLPPLSPHRANCYELTDVGMANILATCPKFQTLKIPTVTLSWCTQVTEIAPFFVSSRAVLLPHNTSISTLRNAPRCTDKDEVAIHNFLSTYRPQHGTHLSFNRGPGKRLCQGGGPDAVDEMKSRINRIEEYLDHDELGGKFLSQIALDLNTQEQRNMTSVNGLCIPPVVEPAAAPTATVVEPAAAPAAPVVEPAAAPAAPVVQPAAAPAAPDGVVESPTNI